MHRAVDEEEELMGRIVTAVAVSLVLASGAWAADTLTVRSPAFTAGSRIPMEHSCEGRGTSPPLEWSGVPAGTRSIAVIVDDPDAPGGTFAHLAILLPAESRSLPADLGGRGGRPADAMFALNSKGEPGYSPVCPPSGVHHYRFQVLALDRVIDLPSGATTNDLHRAVAGHVLASGELVGTYQKGAR
jgi:Raf kinase inhibitor-like YbhB/YbcL family protein